MEVHARATPLASKMNVVPIRPASGEAVNVGVGQGMRGRQPRPEPRPSPPAQRSLSGPRDDPNHIECTLASMAADVVTMDRIVALCKRRGFVFPSSEIYGGVGSTYDYGHYGVLLKNNVKAQWWKAMLQDRDDIVALDSAIIQHPRVWEASGHLAGFTDPLVDCRACKHRFREDHLRRAAVPAEAVQAPGRGRAVRPDRGARLQPDVQDDDRARSRRPGRSPTCAPRPRRASSSTSRTSCSSAARSRRSASRRSASRFATRSRRATSSSARASSSRWRWSSSCRRAEAQQWFEHWLEQRDATGTPTSASAPTTCSCARTTPTS